MEVQEQAQQSRDMAEKGCVETIVTLKAMKVMDSVAVSTKPCPECSENIAAMRRSEENLQAAEKQWKQWRQCAEAVSAARSRLSPQAESSCARCDVAKKELDQAVAAAKETEERRATMAKQYSELSAELQGAQVGNDVAETLCKERTVALREAHASREKAETKAPPLFSAQSMTYSYSKHYH